MLLYVILITNITNKNNKTFVYFYIYKVFLITI